MLYDCKRISYWIDRRLTGLAGPYYDANISFGLPLEPEDSQYGKSRIQSIPRSRNFAVLGIVTDAMRQRLDSLNVARDFLLYDILNDPAAWEDFATEIFHHTLRVV